MRLCAHCEEKPARRHSDFCSEAHYRRARRRWARGLPANAITHAARAGELLREEGYREGRLAERPVDELIRDLTYRVERYGRRRVQREIETLRDAAA